MLKIPKARSLKKYKKLKIVNLCLYEKYLDETTSVWVERWRGETENEYVLLEFAFTERLSVVVGSVEEREMLLSINKKVLYETFEKMDIFKAIELLEWDVANAKVENFASDVK